MKANLPLSEKIKLSQLLNEIKDKSLSNALRDILFQDVSVTEAIKKHRPETRQMTYVSEEELGHKVI